MCERTIIQCSNVIAFGVWRVKYCSLCHWTVCVQSFNCLIVRSLILSQYQRVTDRRTDEILVCSCSAMHYSVIVMCCVLRDPCTLVCFCHVPQFCPSLSRIVLHLMFLSRLSTLTRDSDIAIPSVCLSVRLSRFGILWKRLNILSQFFSQHGSPIILVFLWVLNIFPKLPLGHPMRGAENSWGINIYIRTVFVLSYTSCVL